MKRIFIIKGRSKNVPDNLKETPQIGSLIACDYKLYRVIEVVYYIDSNKIHIILELS